jgi:hypothetical protein
MWNWVRFLPDRRNAHGVVVRPAWRRMPSLKMADCSECGRALKAPGLCIARQGEECQSGSVHRYVNWKCRGPSCRLAYRLYKRRVRSRLRFGSGR